jgi:hypothetical protein
VRDILRPRDSLEWEFFEITSGDTLGQEEVRVRRAMP